MAKTRLKICVFSTFLLSIFSFGFSSDEKMTNNTGWVLSTDRTPIMCACYPYDTCSGHKDHCYSVIGCYTATILDMNGVETRRMGCSASDVSSQFECGRKNNMHSIECCNNTKRCNEHLHPQRVTESVFNTEPRSAPLILDQVILVWICLIIAIATAIGLIFMICRYQHKRKMAAMLNRRNVY